MKEHSRRRTPEEEKKEQRLERESKREIICQQEAGVKGGNILRVGRLAAWWTVQIYCL